MGEKNLLKFMMPITYFKEAILSNLQNSKLIFRISQRSWGLPKFHSNVCVIKVINTKTFA